MGLQRPVLTCAYPLFFLRKGTKDERDENGVASATIEERRPSTWRILSAQEPGELGPRQIDR